MKKNIKPILSYKDNKNMHIINPYRISGGYNPDAFVIEINTQGSSQFILPLQGGFTYNCTVIWGDNTTSTITAYNDPDITHNYDSDGVYVVQITGVFQKIYFNNETQKLKLTKILQWGNVGFTSFLNSFNGCSNLTTIPNSEITGAAAVTNCNNMFILSGISGTLPVDLFRFMPLVTAFAQTFYLCTALTGILPADLFRYNTLVTAFAACFFQCSGLNGLPDNLFYYNNLVTRYDNCFGNCRNLTIGNNIFNLINLNKVTYFSGFLAVSNTIYSATGTVQDIWNYATHPSLLKSGCFAKDISITNYADIPADWK